MVKEPEPKTQIAPRKSSLDAAQTNSGQWKPEQLDPELANIAMARLLVERMGTPSRINPVFNARKAMLTALNHREPVYSQVELQRAYDEIDKKVLAFRKTEECIFSELPARDLWIQTHREEYDYLMSLAVIDPGNPTGYDCSMRIAAYEKWELGSVNVDGWYGEKVWAFLMKPKMIITSLAGQGGLGQEEEKKESLIGRLWGKITGRGKNADNTNQQS
jgi:hypothetical protein